MEFLDLFFTAWMPILKVLLVTTVGLFLATERANLLRANARQHLNGVPTWLTQLLLKVWLPSLAWILVKVTGTPQHLQGLVIGCSSAGRQLLYK
ncbi:hypothetical protein Q3G72_016972 [Acer saccharum]|nr:hypothetical protein Q3G72_016972 [Acer saccharum]